MKLSSTNKVQYNPVLQDEEEDEGSVAHKTAGTVVYSGR